MALIYILVVGWFKSFKNAVDDHGCDPIFARRHFAGTRSNGSFLYGAIAGRFLSPGPE
jgi:hypothetical protein